MASDNEACCESDPNFAVICGFLEKFGVTCGLANIDFLDLQDMLENSQEVPQELVDLHVKLLRKARKSVSSERWERAIIKLCHGFCSQDAWEIERFGYKKARLSSKLRILKELLEMQFDYNAKFKNEVNKLSADELRTQPLGRDRLGHIYWFQSDNSCQIRVYKEDPDEETWALVAKNREGLVDLITHLNDGNQAVVNEDSNSLESEKPVVDTGQSDSNSNSNSNSSKQEPSHSNLNLEEVQENTSKEEVEVEKPQVKSEEEIAQNHAEVIKPTKIRLRGKKAIITDDLNTMAEPDNATANVENNGNTVEEETKSENVEKDEKDSKPLPTVTPPKTGISIRIKPITELISPSSVEINKKVEITGVKEKYIRSDATSSSSVHHRKAVDSAGFDVHTNYLKRPIDEEEDVEEPSYVKRPRLDRPTLLSNKKKKPYSDEEEEDEDEEEVSDEVKEPLMLVQGEGSGRGNENANCRVASSENTEDNSPIVGETIEEDIVFVYGEGSGRECETGNDNSTDKKDAQQQNVAENKSDADSTSGPSKLNPNDQVHEENKAEIVDSIKDSEPSNSFNESDSVKLSTKPEYKLGTIIDVRTNNLIPSVKNITKKSRWDIRKPEGEIIESQRDIKTNIIEEVSDNICLAEEKSANSSLEHLETKVSQTLCNNNDLLESETLKKLNIRDRVTCDTNSSSRLNIDGALPPTSTKVVQEIVSKCEENETFYKNEEVQLSSPTEENNENIGNTKTDINSPEAAPKRSMFFFGPGCLQVKPTISPLKDDHSSELLEDSVEVNVSPTKETIVNQEVYNNASNVRADHNVELKLGTEKNEGNDNLIDAQQEDISAPRDEKNEEKEMQSTESPVDNNGTFTEMLEQEKTISAVEVKNDYEIQDFKKFSPQKSGGVALKGVHSPNMLDNETDLAKEEDSSLKTFKIPYSKNDFGRSSIADSVPKLSDINLSLKDKSTKTEAQYVSLQNYTETSEAVETANTVENKRKLSEISQPPTEHTETSLELTNVAVAQINNSSEVLLKEDANIPLVTNESRESQKVAFIDVDEIEDNKLVATKNSSTCSEQIKVNKAKECPHIAAITENIPSLLEAVQKTSKIEVIGDVIGVTSQDQSNSGKEDVAHDSTKCNKNVEKQVKKNGRELLSTAMVEAHDVVNTVHSRVPNSIMPANDHVPKSSISVSEREIENLRTNSPKTGDKGGSELNDVPVVDKPFSTHSSTDAENKKVKLEKVVEATNLPMCKNQVQNLGVTVKENKPKSKLENVIQKINQVKLIQKTDSIELSIKNKESLSIESKFEPHPVLLDSKTGSIEAQMAIITGEGLPDEYSIDSEMPKSSDIKIPSGIEVPATSKLDIIAALDDNHSVDKIICGTTSNSSITKEVAQVEVTDCGNITSKLTVKSIDTICEASTKIVFPTNADIPEEVSHDKPGSSVKSTSKDIKENADVKPSAPSVQALSEVNKNVINEQTLNVTEQQMDDTSISKPVINQVVQNTALQASVNNSPTSPVTEQAENAKTNLTDDSTNEQSNVNKLNETLNEKSGDNKAQSDCEDPVSKDTVLNKTLSSVDESINDIKELAANKSHEDVLLPKGVQHSNNSTSDVKITSRSNSAEISFSIKSPDQKIGITRVIPIPENLLPVEKLETTSISTGIAKELEATILSDKPVVPSTDKSAIVKGTIKSTTTKPVSIANVKEDNPALSTKHLLDTSASSISDAPTVVTKEFGNTILLDKPVVACTDKSTILQINSTPPKLVRAENVKKDSSALSEDHSLDTIPFSRVGDTPNVIAKELNDKPVATSANKSANLKDIIKSTATKCVRAEDAMKDDKSANLKDVIKSAQTKLVRAENVKKDNSALSDEHSLDTTPSSSVGDTPIITKELKESIISDKLDATFADKSANLEDIIKSKATKRVGATDLTKDISTLSYEHSLDTTPSSSVGDTPAAIKKELKDTIISDKPDATSTDKSANLKDIKSTLTKRVGSENVKKDSSVLSVGHSLDITPPSSVCGTPIVVTQEFKDTIISDKTDASSKDKFANLKDIVKSIPTKCVMSKNIKKDSSALSDEHSLDTPCSSVCAASAVVTKELKDTIISDKPDATSTDKSANVKDIIKSTPTKRVRTENVKKDSSALSDEHSLDTPSSSVCDAPAEISKELKHTIISDNQVATSADKSANLKDVIKSAQTKRVRVENVKKDNSAVSDECSVDATPSSSIGDASAEIAKELKDTVTTDKSVAADKSANLKDFIKSAPTKRVRAENIKKDHSALPAAQSLDTTPSSSVGAARAGITKGLKDTVVTDKPVAADKSASLKDVITSAPAKRVKAGNVKKDNSALPAEQSLETTPSSSVGDAPAVITKGLKDSVITDKPVDTDKCANLKDVIKSASTKRVRAENVKKDNSALPAEQSLETTPSSSVGDAPAVITKGLKNTVVTDEPVAADKCANLKDVIKSAPTKRVRAENVKKDNSALPAKQSLDTTPSSSVGDAPAIITKGLKNTVVTDKPVAADKSANLMDVIKSAPTKRVRAENVKKDNSALSAEQSLDTTPSSSVGDAPAVNTKGLKDTIISDKPVATSANKSANLKDVIKTAPTKRARAENVKKDNSALPAEQSLDTTPSSSVGDTAAVNTIGLKDTIISDKPVATSANKSANLMDVIKSAPTKRLRAENVKKDNSALSAEQSLDTTSSSSVGDAPAVNTKGLKDTIISDKPIATSANKSANLKDVIKTAPTKRARAENVKKDNSALPAEQSLDTTPSSSVGDPPAVNTKELKDTTTKLKDVIKSAPAKRVRAENAKKDNCSLDTPTASAGDTPAVITKELKDTITSDKPVATSAEKSEMLKDTIKSTPTKPIQAEDVKKDNSTLPDKRSLDQPTSKVVDTATVITEDLKDSIKSTRTKSLRGKDVKKDNSAVSDKRSLHTSTPSVGDTSTPILDSPIVSTDKSAVLKKKIPTKRVRAKDVKKDNSTSADKHSLDQPTSSVGDTPAVITKEAENALLSDKPVASPSKSIIVKDTIKSTRRKLRGKDVKKDKSTVSDKRSLDTTSTSGSDTPAVISKELEILDSPIASTDKSATLKDVIKSSPTKPTSVEGMKKGNRIVSGKRSRNRTSIPTVGDISSMDNFAVKDLPSGTDNFQDKVPNLKKTNKQSVEKVCETKVEPITKVIVQTSKKESKTTKKEKSEGSSEKSLNKKELPQTKVEVKTSVLESSSDNLNKSTSKNDNVKTVVQSKEKIPSRRITRRTRSSTLEKPPDVISSVNEEEVSIDNIISTPLSKLEETKIKANLPQVCITKIDITELNENASISVSSIEKSASVTESGTELRKRGRGATQPQNSDVKPRPRGRPSLKKNKSFAENTEEPKTSTDEEKSSTKAVSKVNKKEVEVGGNNRELRGRKGVEKTKVDETEEKKIKGKQLRGKLAVKTPAKEGLNSRGVGRPKGKNNNETPTKPNEDRSFTRSRTQTKDKEIVSKTETGKENTNKPENAISGQNVDLGDIEEQIVRNEIRPSKKLKLTDSVEVTVIDKNKRTVTTHVADKNKAVEKVVDKEEIEDKKEPIKLRRTSNRLSVSSKTESSEKNVKDQNTSNKQEEQLQGEKKVDMEKQEQKTKSTESKKDNTEELKPVVEPKCIQKKVALLTIVDNKVEEQIDVSKDESIGTKDDIKEKIDVTPEPNFDVKGESNDIKMKSDDTKEELLNVSDSDVSDGIANDGGDSSDGIGVIPESDPLGGSEDDSRGSTKNSEPMTLATFKIDLDESSPASIVRVTRKRAAQQSIDALRDTRPRGKAAESESKNNADNKRAKLKRKRSVDRNLRRSIEEKKAKEISSSEEDAMGKMSPQSQLPNKEEHGKKSKAVVKRRISTRSTRASDSPAPSSDAPSEASRTDTSNTPPVTKQRKPRQTKKTLMGLEISPETENIINNDTPIGVRQSRRIAQIKIKEEAERRKLEEVTLYELKEEQRKRKGKKDEDKDYKLEKRKRNKNLPTEDETTTGDAESDEKKKRKRKRKHRDPRKHFDALNPWVSSSGSSSSEIEEEEDEIEEEDDTQLVFKSDHEFSPESDLEEGGEVQPLKRARTARKESDAEEEVDDCACQKCGQKDHPEWILLCDSCDCGWHCSCLRPALLVIPEGDWFCPPCQHITLVKNLESQLLEYDKRLNKREMETRRKERLAYVGISLDNVLPSKESEEYRIKRQHQGNEDRRRQNESYSDSEDSGSDSDSSSNSSSDSEPIYQLRERRQAHSYRFNDYDELINSAIQDELDAVKGAGNQGRGKDIATIVNAEKEEEALRLKQVTGETDVTTTDGVAVDPVVGAIATSETATAVPEPLPPVVPVDYDKKPEDSDDEIIRPVRKIIGKKKHRKLNSLDVSSGDDAESDEDFKGSSSSDSEEDFDDEYSGTDSSDDGDNRRGKRRKDFGPVRRSTRARISRYDRDFINDDDSDSDIAAPRRKKTRSLWDESESEESDRSWGRRKRKAKKSRKKPSGKVKKSKKKKKKRADDSDPEVYRKRPNIKFGGLNDDEEVGRRTRGKKINYLEALGTDSEEEIRKKPPRIEESEEEYFLHEDADFQHQLENDKDSDESGVDTVLQDLAVEQHSKSKPRGRGKSGLKIPRKPKEPPPPDLFPPLMPDVPELSNLQAPSIPTEPALLQPTLLTQPPLLTQQPLLIQPPLLTQPPLITQSLLLEPPMLHEHELQEIEDEPNPIEQINKNVEQMNEQEMEKMMEEEDYANKQLQLVALQIEKEKKRKEREAKRLEKMAEKEQKIPKKRGRKPKSQTLGISTDLVPPFSDSASLLMNSTMANNAELSEPPGVNLPMFSEIAPVLNADGSPKKRRGRGKGKKTLAAEAAAIAAAAAANKDSIDDVELGLEGPASSGSNTVSPAPESPLHGSKLGIATPPQPFSQSQPAPSVITRMLQSQPGQANFPAGVAKYFGGPAGDPQLGPPTSSPYHPGATGPRGQIPGPYQQPPGMSHYPVVRSGPPPPHRLHSPGPPSLPPMYHTHRSLDPSPSGGGPINVPATNRDRHSPAVVPPASSSPLSKGDPTPPPPPYTTRPQVGHFPPVTGTSSLAASGSRHIPMVPPHLQQHRTSSMSPYHPGVPPNYHYGSYPPPPPLNSEEGQPPPGYPSSAYPEPYPAEGAAPVQPPEGSGAKSFDEETSGEFVGLVSYFSSQREDDLDT